VKERFRRTVNTRDASSAQGRLSGHGHLAGVGLYSNLVGGVKLLVRPKDTDAANELLDETVPAQFDVEGLGEYQQPKCTKCGSMDVSDHLPDRYVKAAGFIAGVPLKSTRPGWTCKSCGNNWDDENVASKL
jgi:hypothetical protein